MTKNVRDTDGLKALNLIRSIQEDRYIPKNKKHIKVFGIGYNKLVWVVNDRKDMRHGVVNKPAVKDPYLEQMFNDMFRKW